MGVAASATMTGGGPILLKTNMGAGHGGASGRFDHLEDIGSNMPLRSPVSMGASLWRPPDARF